MDKKAIKLASERRWRDRAEEMLTISGTMQTPEMRLQMERLAADWLNLAVREAEQHQLAHNNGKPEGQALRIADHPGDEPGVNGPREPLATVR